MKHGRDARATFFLLEALGLSPPVRGAPERNAMQEIAARLEQTDSLSAPAGLLVPSRMAEARDLVNGKKKENDGPRRRARPGGGLILTGWKLAKGAETRCAPQCWGRLGFP